jgi:hypothetical protein
MLTWHAELSHLALLLLLLLQDHLLQPHVTQEPCSRSLLATRYLVLLHQLLHRSQNQQQQAATGHLLRLHAEQQPEA